MPTFQADTNEISDAAGQLGCAAMVLNVSYAGASPSSLGFASAEAALTNFITAWTIGAATLSKGLSAVQQGMDTVGMNYAWVERNNACVMVPNP